MVMWSIEKYETYGLMFPVKVKHSLILVDGIIPFTFGLITLIGNKLLGHLKSMEKVLFKFEITNFKYKKLLCKVM